MTGLAGRHLSIELQILTSGELASDKKPQWRLISTRDGVLSRQSERQLRSSPALIAHRTLDPIAAGTMICISPLPVVRCRLRLQAQGSPERSQGSSCQSGKVFDMFNIGATHASLERRNQLPP